MTIDDTISKTLDYKIISDAPRFEKELKKDIEWKNDVAIEYLIADDELKQDIIKFCERKDVQHPSYWIEKNRVMKEYKRQCAEHLMNEYGWPKLVAKQIARTVRIPRKKTSAADIVAGYFVASLPKRYVEPVAKLMGADRKFYTNINIVADAVWLGISAYTIFGIGDNSPAYLQHTQNFLTNGFMGTLTYANAAVRAVQIPIRTICNMKGIHTWSPATFVNPDLVETVPFAILLGYDYILKIKNHHKNRKQKVNFLK
jgi:hypothetical protein